MSGQLSRYVIELSDARDSDFVEQLWQVQTLGHPRLAGLLRVRRAGSEHHDLRAFGSGGSPEDRQWRPGVCVVDIGVGDAEAESHVCMFTQLYRAFLSRCEYVMLQNGREVGRALLFDGEDK
ncbi:MAG: hypothetical protein AAFZ67_11375 [Planctomycetota bacterium]